MASSLSSKITMSVGAVLLALSAVVTALTFVQTQQAAIAEKQALADVMNYTFEILLSQESFPSLQRVVENDATNSEVQKVVIADRAGIVLASSDRMEVGLPVTGALLREFLEKARSERATRRTEDALVILQPLRGHRFLGGATGDIEGAAEVTISLGLIKAEARAVALRFLSVSLGSFIALSVALVVVLRVMVSTPVRELAAVARRFRDGDRQLRSQIRRKDEIGLLSETFDDMANEVDALLRSLSDQVAERTADLEAERGALEQTLEELKATTAARVALADAVREMSTPVIKLYDQILVLPLIGNIDRERAAQIEVSLLDGIARHDAAEVILDLTGVPFVDTQVAAALMRAATAARLLGAGVTIVGISAEVARSIVQLGIDFSGIRTYANLKSGLVHALGNLGFSIRRV